MGLYDLSFYNVITRNAIAFGERLCWNEVDDGRTLTFAEYKTEVERLAAGLSQAGLKKGDRLGVVGKNSLEFFLLYGAAAFLGVIVLPVNWRLSAEEMQFNLNDCTPVIVFADDEFQPALQAQRAALPTVTAWYNLKDDTGSFTAFGSLMQESGQPRSADVKATTVLSLSTPPPLPGGHAARF